uniref:hypothetical protein n=1 Tax=Thaumasiovibrio occultus TaxID=1891184 RepID=UPI00131B7397|nr:hypothetical protein [Thaumasiovibrio occultus]
MVTMDRQRHQERKYNNSSFAAEIRKDNAAIIQHFIGSESEAQQFGFQGMFYPYYHYEITRVLNGNMAKIPADDIQLAYYYALKLSQLPKPTERNVHLYWAAAAQCWRDPESTSRMLDLHMMFGDFNRQPDFTADFESISSGYRFCTLSQSYTSNFGQREKRARFQEFADNPSVMARVRTLLRVVYDHQMLVGGMLIVLLLDDATESKATLQALHSPSLSASDVWWLGSYYKDFQQTEANQALLRELYAKYPTEWVDEYQSAL